MRRGLPGKGAVTIPYKEVADAALAHVKAEGKAELFRIRWDLARDTFGDRAKDQWGALSDTYCGQVLRALNAEALEGRLVKDKVYNDVWFYTPEAWADKQAEDEKARAWRADQKARWEAVYDITEHAGFDIRTARGEPIKLSLESWEHLAAVLK